MRAVSFFVLCAVVAAMLLCGSLRARALVLEETSFIGDSPLLAQMRSTEKMLCLTPQESAELAAEAQDVLHEVILQETEGAITPFSLPSSDDTIAPFFAATTAEASYDPNTVIVATQDALYVAELPADMSVSKALLLLADDPQVVYAQPNYLYTLIDDVVDEEADAAFVESLVPSATTINDPEESKQWHLAYVKIFEAWDTIKVQGSVTVAVVDTGIDMDHPDLKDNIDTEHAYDIENECALTGDLSGHGTHVAGLIAATANNGVGVAGVSYNAKILPLNIFHALPNGKLSAGTAKLLEAYSYLLDAGIDNLKVINLSMGGTDNDRSLQKAIKKAYDAGILTVCAAGNGSPTGSTMTTYPSDYESCVSVINLTSSSVRSSTSNFGAAKDISAPGTSIYSTIPPKLNTATMQYEYYGSKNGTSMASPIVAGIAALLFAADTSLTPREAKIALYATAIDLDATGFDIQTGWGRVDAAAAVQRVTTHPMFSVSQMNVADVAAVTYTGGELKPLPVVTSYGVGLVLDTDYTLAYSNNVDKGQATITITGAGEFAGSMTKAFTINPASIEGATFSKLSTVVYTGTPFEPKPVLSLKLGGETVTLEEGRDYTLSYSGNIEAGTATIKATGQGNFTGEASTSFEIVLFHERLAGATRYDTMESIVARAFDGSTTQTAIVATGETFPDALAAAGLAGLADAPVLITDSNVLLEQTARSLSNLDVTKVLIVGGEGAVSDEVREQISRLPGIEKVERIGGSNRLETAYSIYEAGCVGSTYLDTPGWGTTAILATGVDFPDSLSVSPFAYESSSPIFLTQGAEHLELDVLRELTSGSFERVLIVGGTGVVSESIEDELHAIEGLEVIRCGGANRYETSLSIAQWVTGEMAGDKKLSSSIVAVATGVNYPDALCGAVLCGKYKGILILADDGEQGKSAVNSLLDAHPQSIERIFFLGGDGVLSPSLEEEIIAQVESEE